MVQSCDAADACDVQSPTCVDACTAAESAHGSVGCDYYATAMDSLVYDRTVYRRGGCFAAFVANTWTTPAHIAVEYAGGALDVEQFARIPSGSGPSLTYDAYQSATGLAPGEVAILFLGGAMGAAPLCPIVPAAPGPQLVGTGISNSFHITSDVPVVAYQINPYGGGSAAMTGASLLIPTSAWDQNYIAVNVSPGEDANGTPLSPSMNIIAREDGTVVTLTPNAIVIGGGAIPSGIIDWPMAISLAKGQHAQITQPAELTGSVITANKPVGVMAGQTCMRMPAGTPYCDHGEQMIPPVRALGRHYVGVMYRPRVTSEFETYWRIIGAVDGTTLTYSTAVGGPTMINKGQSQTFSTGTPFIVSSQDTDHPFMLFTYMTGGTTVIDSNGLQDYGDPDFVLDVSPDQYLQHYVFFTDPTYPETNLVLIRGLGADLQFHDVTLDCAGAITAWTPIGSEFQYARVDLQTDDFQAVGGCSNGRHEIHSDAPFGLQVWGWGTPNTTSYTKDVSYGYPGGMNVHRINNVTIQ